MKNYQKMTKNELIQEIINLQGKLPGQGQAADETADVVRHDPQTAEKFLQERVSEEVKKRLAEEQLLVLENRQALMEELVGNLAHQWRQPLNIIGLTVQKMQFDFERKEVDESYLDELVKEIVQTVKQMSRTVQTFRDLLKADKVVSEFNLNEAVWNVASFAEESMKSADISIKLDFSEEDIIINGYRNELSCILLNLLNKSKNTLLGNRTEKPCITVRLFRQGIRSVLTIHDNGGGSQSMANAVLEPKANTTLLETDMGLYLAKMVIERKMKGKMTTSTTSNGVEFRIEL